MSAISISELKESQLRDNLLVYSVRACRNRATTSMEAADYNDYDKGHSIPILSQNGKSYNARAASVPAINKQYEYDCINGIHSGNAGDRLRASTNESMHSAAGANEATNLRDSKQRQQEEIYFKNEIQWFNAMRQVSECV